MKYKTALISIFFISLFGLVFSGTLSYQELFQGSCTSCPAPGAPGTVFGYPACVYGFFMYLILTGIAGISLWTNRTKK